MKILNLSYIQKRLYLKLGRTIKKRIMIQLKTFYKLIYSLKNQI